MIFDRASSPLLERQVDFAFTLFHPAHSLLGPAHDSGRYWAASPMSRDRLHPDSPTPSRHNPDLYIACCLSVLVFLVYHCRLSDALIHKLGSRHSRSRLHRRLGHVGPPTSGLSTLGILYTLDVVAPLEVLTNW